MAAIPAVFRRRVNRNHACFMASVHQPHELADLDVGVVRAHFGMAESGAVSITREDLVVDAPVCMPDYRGQPQWARIGKSGRAMQRLWLDGAIEEGLHRERKEK
jgi:hypothetical protein